jgi:hypothetical protein
MYIMTTPKLVEVFKRQIHEAQGDEPVASANPFDEPAKAKPKLPTVGSVGTHQKPQTRSASAPSKSAPPPQTQLQKAYSDFEKHPKQAQTNASLGTGPKPPYKGKFFGQTWQTNSSVQSKPTSWIDRPTGDRKFGRVQSMGKTQLVWDGNDWITGADFDKKYGKH